MHPENTTKIRFFLPYHTVLPSTPLLRNEMAASAFAVSMARAGQSFRSTLNTVLSRRLFHSPVPSSRHPIGLVSSLVGDVIRRRPIPYAAVRLIAGGGADWLNPIRFRIERLGYSHNSPINSGSGGGSSDRPPTGCDEKHWLVVMDKSGRENATKEQRIDCYIKTLAMVVGSEEEAIQKIYKVSCKRYFGFGCKLDEESANKLEGLPGVLFVLPEDAEDKDPGADLFVNGQILEKSPERQGGLSHSATESSRPVQI